MVKLIPRKLLRVFSFAAALFVICVPLLLTGASALVIVPDVSSSGNPLDPLVYEMSIPLDVFSSDVTGITIDNPLYSVVVEDGYNTTFSVDMPFLSESELAGDPLSRWTFGVSSISRVDAYSAAVVYDLQVASSQNWNRFTMSASSDFILYFDTVKTILRSMKYTLQPGYTVTASVSFSGFFPKHVTNLVSSASLGYELVPVSDSQTFVSSNMENESVDVAIFSKFRDALSLGGYFFHPSDPSEGMRAQHVLFTEFSITIDIFNPFDGVLDVGSQNVPNASFQTFSFSVYDPSTEVTMRDFFEAYPRKFEVLHSSNDVGDVFDLSKGLGKAASAFFEVEISPGVSLGGILTVVVGLSLTIAYLALFR